MRPGGYGIRPYNSFRKRLDKLEFEDGTIPSTPNGVTIADALCTHCPPALPADKLDLSYR